VAGKFDFVAEASEPTLVMTQTFDAGRTDVFDAWTDKEQVALWWNPSGTQLAVCEIDLRPGGIFAGSIRAKWAIATLSTASISRSSRPKGWHSNLSARLAVPKEFQP